MKAALAVGLGGLLGSLARYQLGGLVLHLGFETVYLLRRHEAPRAVANVVVSVVAGMGAVWLGWKAVELLTG